MLGEVPVPSAVAQHQDHERRERQRPPEQHGAEPRRRVHLRVLEIGQATGLEAGPPARRLELRSPVGLGGRDGFETALAVGTVELQRHRSDRSAVARSARAGSSSPAVDGCGPPPSSSQSSISWVNETSLEKRAPTDSPRWMRLIASPISGATDRTVICGIRFAAASGTESVITTSRSVVSRMRSIAGSLMTPCVAQAYISVTPSRSSAR